MRRSLLLAISFIAGFACVSCNFNQPEIQEPVEKKDAVFTADLESVTTKTTVSDAGKVYWTIDDKISINGVTFGIAALSEDKTSASFNGSLSASSEYEAFYPSTLYSDGMSVLPSSFDYREGFNMPMYAKSSTTELEFRNICSVFKVTVNCTDIVTISSITMSSADKAMSGDFTVDSGFNAVLEKPGMISNTVTVNCGEGVPNGTVFYIPVPPQDYKRIKVSVSGIDEDGNEIDGYLATSSDTAFSAVRSELYILSMTTYKPATGILEYKGQLVDTEDARH